MTDDPSSDMRLFPQPIEVRYEGLSADRHEMDLADLAESMKGLARIIGSTSNFEATGRANVHKDAFAVRVVVHPPEAHCFAFLAAIHWIDQSPLLTAVTGGLTVTAISYIFARAAGKKEEMKQLRGALDTAIHQLGSRDQSTVDRLLSTIDRMADSLRPAVKQAVHPIGASAKTLSILSPSGGPVTKIDEADKAAILAEPDAEVGAEATYRVLINELDMETGSCKVALQDDEERRFNGRITDPAFSVANNPYALALASKQWLPVRAKPIMRNGEIDRLYISDTSPS